ncbi:uncharacterized protein LOC123192056 [Mangifera indica]|uniref:uncharacterized protein LOC123192056 n=1 Tax=Mangifera indica TaxID=29780 RepID=UPI001CFAA740|nr:uncharacterized protein LOC123192056 [Mangifera indica]
MGKIHPSHPDHELQLKCFEKPYTCDGCKQRGIGSRYRCDLCNFELHEECMFASPTAHHDFFKNSDFKFLYQPPGQEYFREDYRYCDACGQTVKGFVYHNEKNGWDLHPCCQKLPCKVPIDGVRFELCKKVLSKCHWCNKKKPDGSVSKIRGWSYVSKCNKYHIHVNCFKEMVLEGWENRACQDDCSLTLQNLELPLQRKNRNQRNGNKFSMMVKIFFKTIAAILLGDPTISLTCLLVKFLSK